VLIAAAQEVATPVPVSPSATPAPALILPTATDTPAALALALTTLPTPVLIVAAEAGVAGGLTPTPILMAQMAAGQAEAPVETASRPGVAFDVGLLPGYGAFLLIAALLSGAAVWVWQRRRAP
jgi:hypothetical protein